MAHETGRKTIDNDGESKFRVTKTGVKDWLLDSSSVAAGNAVGAAVTSLVSYAVDRGIDGSLGAIGGNVSAGAAFPTESTLSIAGRVLSDVASSPEMKKIAAFVLRAGARHVTTTLVSYAVDRGVDSAVGAIGGIIAAGGAFGF